MQELMRQGELPAISAHLGKSYPAVTVFPSTTGPAYMPFLTGSYPGTCNVPGIRWFDKSTFAQRRFSHRKFRSYVGGATLYINGDMAPVPSLFKLLPRSSNIFSSINRGVSWHGNKTTFSRIWYWYYAHLTDHWGVPDRAATRKMLQAAEEDFQFMFVVYPGIDEFSHLHSPFGERTREAYREIDRAVGSVVAQLKQSRRWDETCIMIVSDHGLSETRKHFGLNRFLEEEMGLPTLYYPKTVFKKDFVAASMVSGNGMSHLYLRNSHGAVARRSDWAGRTFWETILARPDRLVERLLEHEEVDLIAGQRSDGAVVVRSRRGEAVISVAVGAALRGRPNPGGPGLDGHDGGRHIGLPLQYQIKYQSIGSDPFGYPQFPTMMTERETLDRTITTDYPDALVQLLQIFRSGRTGDLVLSAKKGFDLRQRHEVHEHKSSHGSLHREHMMIPLVTNVTLPNRAVRSVDVFPTILSLLGQPIPGGIDGVSLNPP